MEEKTGRKPLDKPVPPEGAEGAGTPERQEEEEISGPASVQEDVPQAEDEIFGAIDRFWALGIGGAPEQGPEQEQPDLLMMLGGYLKMIDV